MRFLEFLHGRVEALEQVLESANSVLACYAGPDMGEGTGLAGELLDLASTTYRNLGMTTAANEILTLATKVQQARSGIDPRNGLRVAVHRREMQQAVCFEAVREACTRWRLDHDRAQRLIEQLRERLMPLVEYAFDARLVPKPRAGLAPSQAQLEAVWRSLLDDVKAGPAARQVSMSASVADIQIVLGDLVDVIWANQAPDEARTGVDQAGDEPHRVVVL